MTAIKEIAVNFIPNVLGGLVTIMVFLSIAAVFKKLVTKLPAAVDQSGHIKKLVASTVYYLIVIVGLLTGLNTMGVRMGPVIASLGLGGFALGFALKDVVSNLLAGLLILAHKPFKEGDYLLVSGCEGKVVEINMRYTILSGNNSTYMIPNAAIFTNPLQLKEFAKEKTGGELH